eukprot:CAMPEP_0184691348 /NCGR_PEP_ID=MMETSP0313-20130426/237_1 /TAXON_ID=2792 /ORGANISM="Porphyridium aerugineum, Strain SAG 1380-2" /LENGTH=177 /DNA_ID=CAMNT_0027149045 /DNA_START=57 /DNA_END=590 /DNA_ORIENTATION=+
MAFVSAFYGAGVATTAFSSSSTTICKQSRSTLVMQDKKGGLFGGFPGLGGNNNESPAPNQAGGSGGLFGGMGNIMEAMKKAKEFSEATAKLQEELKAKEVSVKSADGFVTVVVSGQQLPIKIDISDELISKGAEATSASVTEAVILAHTTSVKMMRDELSALSVKYGLPPMGAQAPK